MENEPVRLVFSGSIPRDVAVIIQDYLKEWSWLLPAWTQRLHVYFNDEQDGCAETSVNQTYRFASIHIRADFLNQPECERKLMTVHELIHVATVPCWDYARKKLKQHIENEELSKEVLDHLLALHEQGVQDLADRIFRQFDGG